MKLNQIRLLCVAALALLVSCTIYPVKGAHLFAPSDWGGEHVVLTISQNGATFEFDCAHGQTDQPITVDKDGNFDAPGTFTPDSVGPARRDENPPADRARYSGHIEGDTMTLKVVRAEKDPGTFTLTRGAHPMLKKCR
jgi:hypothetical protein